MRKASVLTAITIKKLMPVERSWCVASNVLPVQPVIRFVKTMKRNSVSVWIKLFMSAILTFIMNRNTKGAVRLVFDHFEKRIGTIDFLRVF